MNRQEQFMPIPLLHHPSFVHANTHFATQYTIPSCLSSYDLDLDHGSWVSSSFVLHLPLGALFFSLFSSPYSSIIPLECLSFLVVFTHCGLIFVHSVISIIIPVPQCHSPWKHNPIEIPLKFFGGDHVFEYAWVLCFFFSLSLLFPIWSALGSNGHTHKALTPFDLKHHNARKKKKDTGWVPHRYQLCLCLLGQS